LVALAALVLAFGTGCGEKEEPATTGPVVEQTTSGGTGTTTTTPGGGGQSDQQSVTTSATDFLTLPGEEVCDTGITDALLRSVYGDRAGCVAARTQQSLAESVQVEVVRVEQGIATLTADARGGTYGSGQKLEMTVVRDGAGTWRVDQVRSNVPVGP